MLASIIGTGAYATNTHVREIFAVNQYETGVTIANSNREGDELKLTGFVANGEVGKSYNLPTPTVSAGTAVKVSILNPRGVYEAKDQVITTSNGYEGNESGTLELKYSGIYTLLYTATNSFGMTTTSEQLTINVSSNKYEITKPTNSPYVLPTTVKVEQEGLKVELPTVKKADEEQTLLSKVDNAIVRNTDADTSLEIYLEDKNSTKTVLVDTSENQTELTKVQEENGRFYVAIDKNLLSQGTYIVHYRYYEGTNSDTRVLKDTETTRFTASNVLDTSTIKLQMSYDSAKPTATSIKLGQENTLPTVTVKNKTNGSTINAYTTITVDYKEKNANEYKTLGTFDTFKTTLFEKEGDYRITYKVSLDLFGVEAITDTFRIDNVTDNTKPTLYVVDAYTIDEQNKADLEHLTSEKIEEMFTVAEHRIPNTVQMQGGKATISLPAMYATDNLTNSSELVYKIDYRKASNNTRRTFFNSANANETKKYNEEMLFDEITEAGDYTIIYSVEDKKGNVTDRSFSLTVYKEGDEEYVDKVSKATPTVTFTLSQDYIDSNADLVFDKPTAKDSYDTRIKLETYYTLNNETEQRKLNTNDQGKYVIEKELFAGKSSITIVVTATNDRGATKTVRRTIRVSNATNSADKLHFDSMTATGYLNELYELNGTTAEDGIDQGQNVKLPDMTAVDALGNNLSLDVVVRDKNNKITTVFNGYTTTPTGSTVTDTTSVTMVSGAYFKATYAGKYTITYIASNNGNYVAKTYEITINNTQLPELVLSNITSLSSSIQLGKAFYPEKARLTEDGTDLPLLGEETGATAVTKWSIYQAQRPEYLENENAYAKEVYDKVVADEVISAEYTQALLDWEQANKVLTHSIILGEDGTPAGFVPKEAGVYYIEYQGSKNGVDWVSKVVSVKAEDTTKPVITLDSGYQEYYNAFKEDTEGSKSMKITLPGFTVTDPYEQDYASLVASKSVTVVNSDGDKFETTIQEDGSYVFYATKDDSYTVTYNAKDSSGLAAESYKFTVYIGDYEDPTLTFTDTKAQEKLIPTTLKLGQTFTLDTADLVQYLMDNRTDADKIKVTAVLRNSSNASMTNSLESENSADQEKKNKYSYTLDKAGTYTLTLTLKDEVGNRNTYTYTITVTEKTDGNKNVVGTVVGTVLIVLSLGLLAGVIIYFAVTSKKGKKSTKKAKSNKNTTKK